MNLKSHAQQIADAFKALETALDADDLEAAKAACGELHTALHLGLKKLGFEVGETEGPGVVAFSGGTDK